MENQVRIFRKNPIAWWDKNVMRFLREKYGKDKKTFMMVRSVYLALCEIESDFSDKPVRFFTKTVGTYAGLSREAAGKYINLLVKEGLIKKSQTKDPTSKKFSSGTEVEILDLENVKSLEKPLSGYPDDGVLRRRDTPTTIKKLSISKKLSTSKKLNTVNGEKEKGKNGVEILKRLKNFHHPPEKVDYIADSIVNQLGDEHSRDFYKLVAYKVPETVIHTTLAEIKADGARNPAKVFTYRMKEYAFSEAKKGLIRSFKPAAT